MSSYRRTLRFAPLALAVGLVLTATSGPAGAATDRLPDLRMSYPRAFTVDTSTMPDHRLLRFSTLTVNVGDGPFEVHGQRPDTSTATMSVSQVVYDAVGGRREIPTSDVMLYDVGDGHHHWHLQGLAKFTLLRPDGSLAATSPKVGFCFFDGSAYQLSLPGAPQQSVYQRAACGTPTSLEVRAGLSVGWADTYRYVVANQWIDVTGVPDGAYKVRVTADASGYFLEINEQDNSNYANITLQGTTVRVIGHGPK
jgi:hypothetical protein